MLRVTSSTNQLRSPSAASPGNSQAGAAQYPLPHSHLDAANDPRTQRSASPGASTEDEGYASANSWDHSSHHAGDRTARVNGYRHLPPSAPQFSSVDHEPDSDAGANDSVSSSASADSHPAVRAEMPPAMPSRPPPSPGNTNGLRTIQLDQCQSRSIPAYPPTRTPTEQSEVAKFAEPAQTRTHLTVERRGSAPRQGLAPDALVPSRQGSRRNPDLTSDPAFDEAETVPQSQGQDSAALRRMASTLGPKLTKNAPAPWEIEDGDEEFLGPPVPKMSRDRWGRKSTDVREHNQARPSMDSSRFDPTNQLYDDASSMSNGNSFFASTRARSKSVSNSAAGVLKGLGLSSSTATPSAKKKLAPKLPKPSKKDELKKPRLNLAAGISSEDYQKLPPDWSPSTADGASFVSQHSGGAAQSSSPAASRTSMSSMRPQAKPDAIPPLPTERYGVRQSSSAESNNLSATSPTDVSQSSNTTAATSPATPSFTEPYNLAGKGVNSLQSTVLHPQGDDAEFIADADSHLATPSSTSAMEGTPYKLISLEQARMNQVRSREKSLAHEAKGAEETPRVGVAPDGFAHSVSINSLGSAGQSAETRSLRNKKSGFLRMFNKDRPAQMIPNLPGSPSSHMSAMADSSHAVLRPRAPTPSAPTEPAPQALPAGLTAPALSLRPMSSIFSGFQSDMLDGSLQPVGDGPPNSAVSDGESGTVKSVHSEDTPSGPQPLSSRRRVPQPVEITTPAYSGAQGPKSSGSLALPSAGHARSSFESESNGHYYSPITPSIDPVTDVDRDASRGSISSSAAHKTSFEASQPSPVWRGRAADIEQKIAELAAELTSIRQANSSSLGVADYTPSPSSPVAQSPGPTGAFAFPIPSCSACGCSCAEKRRQQSLNEAAILKGLSVLERGRAIKPLGEGNTSKFGGHWDRQ